jgi:hypothetical protein
MEIQTPFWRRFLSGGIDDYRFSLPIDAAASAPVMVETRHLLAGPNAKEDNNLNFAHSACYALHQPPEGGSRKISFRSLKSH